MSTLISATTGFEFTDDPIVQAVLYFTIALLGFGAIIAFLVYRFNNQKFADFKKTALGIGIGYSLAIIILMAVISFDTEIGFGKDGIVPLLFYPILTAILVAAAGALALWVCSLFSKKYIRIVGLVTAVLEIGAFIAIMVCMSQFYNTVKNDPSYADETYIMFSTVNNVGLIVSGIVFMLLAGVIYFIGNKSEKDNNTKALSYGAVAIAMSFALSYIRFMKMPQGGSITFASLLPLMVYCCMFGTRRGTIACLIYGVLQAVQDPFILHPMQFLLDYPLAFGMIGISGIFMEKKVFAKVKGGNLIAFVCGAIVAVMLRYACHACSGAFAFASYASNPESYTAVASYTLAYNSFAIFDMMIAIAAGVLLFSSRVFVSRMLQTNAAVLDATDSNYDEEINSIDNADNESDIAADDNAGKDTENAVESDSSQDGYIWDEK